MAEFLALVTEQPPGQVHNVRDAHGERRRRDGRFQRHGLRVGLRVQPGDELDQARARRKYFVFMHLCIYSNVSDTGAWEHARHIFGIYPR